MRNSWTFLVLVTLVACDCGKQEQAPVAYEPLTQLAPSPEPRPDKGKMPYAECEGLLGASDVEQLCGVAGLQAKSDRKGACERRLKGDVTQGKRSVVLTVWESGDEAAAKTEYARRDSKAADHDEGYAKVQGVGAEAHSFTSGKGKMRAGPAVAFLVVKHVAELR